MSSLAIPWDRIAASINAHLPAWARYEGYGTYALGAYLYVALSGALAVMFYLSDVDTAAYGLGAFAIVGLLIGNYYRTAAQLRVKCSHCGRNARGNDECPHCGKPSFKAGENA